MKKIATGSGSAYVAANLKNRKLFLLCVLVIAAVLDLVVSLVLLISGVGFNFFIYPLVMLVLDLLFLAVTLTSNFRFAYTVAYGVIYLVATLVLTGLEIILNSLGDVVVLPDTASVVWAVSHVAIVVGIVMSWVIATRRIKSILASAALGLVFVAISAMGALWYGAYVMTGGFFGQGGVAYRALTYVYDEVTDTYEVTGVLGGRGSRVIIPETFNGSKVAAVDCEVFVAGGVRSVELSDTTVELKNSEKLVSMNEGIVVGVSKDHIDSFKKSIYEKAASAKDKAVGAKLFELSNDVFPNDIAANQVYMTFAYDLDSYDRTDGKVLPTYIGSKGATFSLESYEGEFEYVQRRDINKESDLYYNSENSDGYILSALVDGDHHSLDGEKIEKNYDAVGITFDKIYKVRVSVESNDTKYSTPDSFVQFENSGYRYVVKSTADGLLTQLSRDGFDLTWQSGRDTIDSLVGVIEKAEGNIVDLAPHWELKKPTINLAASSAEQSITYGESATMRVSAHAPVDGYDLSYEWKFGGKTISGETAAEYVIQSMPWDGKGAYTVTVTASSGTATSLTSTVDYDMSVNVLKREIFLTWSGNGTYTYSDADRVLTCSINAFSAETKSGVINDDVVSLLTPSNTYTNAGSYTVNQRLTGADSEKYVISSSTTATNSVVITPAEITVTWGNSEFTYDCDADHKPISWIPSATFNGKQRAEDDLKENVAGEQMLAGEHYVATASIDNANYVIRNGDETKEFKINKRQVELVWTKPTNGEYEYNAKNQYPTIDQMPTNYVDSWAGVSYLDESGKPFEDTKNVGTYKIKATLSNQNYEITNPEAVSYTITAKPVEFVWAEQTFTYNGSVQHPTVASITDYLDGEFANKLTYTVADNGGRNAGTHAVTAKLADNNYDVTNANESKSYTIGKCGVEVSWNDTSLTYNGQNQRPTLRSITGYVGTVVDALEYTVQEGESKSVGDYHVTVTFVSDLDKKNYELRGNSTSFTIGAKSVAFNWQGLQTTYNGKLQTINVSSIDGYLDSDGDFTEKLTYTWKQGNTDVESPINAGTYTVTATLADTNYIVTNRASSTYTIGACPVEVSWSNTSLPYNGQNQHPTVISNSSYLGTLNDALKYSVDGDDSKNVGGYRVSIEFKSDLDKNNYSLSSSFTDFTIDAKPVTFKWSETRSFTYNGELQCPFVESIDGYESTDGLFADKTSYTVTGEDGSKNAGNYSVKAVLSDTNYTVTNANTAVQYTIVAKGITINWSDTNATYNGSAQSAVATAVGLVGRDNAQLSAVTPYTNKGSYTVSVTVGNTNYTITSGASTTFTIDAKPVTFNWSSPRSFEYNGSAQHPTVTSITDYESVDSAFASKLTYAFKSSGETVQSTVNAGSYTVTATLNDTNYIVDNAATAIEYTITAKPITINWTNTTVTYNGSAQSAVATAVGLEGSDNAQLSAVTPYTNKGSYTVSVTAGNPNYTITSGASTTFTIQAKPIKVDFHSVDTVEKDEWNEGVIAELISGITYTVSEKDGNATLSSDIVSVEYPTNDVTDTVDEDGNHTVKIKAVVTVNSNYSLATTEYTITINVTVTHQEVDEEVDA